MTTTADTTSIPTTRTLRFTGSEPQYYLDAWRHEVRRCDYMGRCITCDRRTYAFQDGQNDPRGPLGEHAADGLDASEYSMTGPTVTACFLCLNTETTYKQALAAARALWRPKHTEA